MQNDLFKIIYNHPSFNKKDFNKIIDVHTKINVKKGDLFLKIGKVANEYFLIENGLFRSFAFDYNGSEITTGFYTQNEILIEVSSLFQKIPSNENLQALSNGTVWKIEFNDFQELFSGIKSFPEWGRTWMTNQLFISKQRNIDMLTKSATDRYLFLLNEKPEIISQAPLKYIASYLGITDTSLSRIRKEISTY